MNPLAAVSIALALSLAANAGMGYLYLGKRDELAKADVYTSHAEGLAESCSKSVETLASQAVARAATNAINRALAGASSAKSAEKADIELSTAATKPGDDCQSATDRVQRLLKAKP